MKDSTKGYLLCLIGVACWSFSEITTRVSTTMGSSTVGPIMLSFYRFFFGGLFLLLLISMQRDTSGMKQLVRGKKNQGILILSSMFGLGISNVIYFVGVKLTNNASLSSALYTTYPIFICIYSIFLLKEKTNIPLKFVGLALGFLGTIILVNDFSFDNNVGAGMVLLILAAAIWSLYSVLGKMLFRLNPGIKRVEIKFTTISFFYACVPIFIILLFSDELPTLFQHSTGEWGLIAFMAIVITALGLYAFYTGVKKIEVSRGISLALLKPVMATVWVIILIHLNIIPFENVSWVLLISIPTVSVAVLLINKKSKEEQTKNIERDTPSP
ncbi:MAG: DMT family transporter [Promethearchaeota archaeon]